MSIASSLPASSLKGSLALQSGNATISLEHYEHMISVGAFDEPYNIPVELLRGEIVMRSPIGEPHSLAVVAITEWSYEVIDLQRFMVRVQMPIRIPAFQGEPEPDLAWVRRESAGEKPPLPEDVLLLIEVADSSLAMDRTKKLAIYAEAGILEYWIVNLIDKQIEVYREPSGQNYQQKTIARSGDTITPLALPAKTLDPTRIFGNQAV